MHRTDSGQTGSAEDCGTLYPEIGIGRAQSVDGTLYPEISVGHAQSVEQPRLINAGGEIRTCPQYSVPEDESTRVLRSGGATVTAITAEEERVLSRATQSTSDRSDERDINVLEAGN